MPLADVKTVWDLFDRSIGWGVGVIVALLLLAWAAYRLRSWYGDDTDHADAGQELLLHLRQLRAEGDVSEAEYRSIKGRLAASLELSPPPLKDSGAGANQTPAIEHGEFSPRAEQDEPVPPSQPATWNHPSATNPRQDDIR